MGVRWETAVRKLGEDYVEFGAAAERWAGVVVARMCEDLDADSASHKRHLQAWQVTSLLLVQNYMLY